MSCRCLGPLSSKWTALTWSMIVLTRPRLSTATRHGRSQKISKAAEKHGRSTSREEATLAARQSIKPFQTRWTKPQSAANDRKHSARSVPMPLLLRYCVAGCSTGVHCLEYCSLCVAECRSQFGVAPPERPPMKPSGLNQRSAREHGVRDRKQFAARRERSRGPPSSQQTKKPSGLSPRSARENTAIVRDENAVVSSKW